MVPKTKKDFFLCCKGTSYVKTLREKSLLAHFAAKKEPFPWSDFLLQWLYLYSQQLLQVALGSRCYHLNSDARIRVSMSQQVAQRRRAFKQDRKKMKPFTSVHFFYNDRCCRQPSLSHSVTRCSSPGRLLPAARPRPPHLLRLRRTNLLSYFWEILLLFALSASSKVCILPCFFVKSAKHVCISTNIARYILVPPTWMYYEYLDKYLLCCLQFSFFAQIFHPRGKNPAVSQS